MQKLSDKYKKNNLDEKLMINFNKSLKDEEFKNFVELLGLSYEELSKYTSILEDSYKEYSHCKNCKSILECTNKMEGYAYLPEVKNKQINFNYKMCRYKKELEEKKKYLNNVYTFDIPKDIINADFKDIYTEDKNRKDTIKYIGTFLKEYLDGKNPKGLYLYGNFGCGKTYLICSLFNELAKKNIKSSIVFWPEYLRKLKLSFNNSDEFKIIFDSVKESPLLLIDDVGAEKMTDWARDEILCPILQYRMEEHLPTFFTSNLDIDSLEHHLSISKDGVSDIKARRIIERIKQLTVNQEMISKNLRN